MSKDEFQEDQKIDSGDADKENALSRLTVVDLTKARQKQGQHPSEIRIARRLLEVSWSCRCTCHLEVSIVATPKTISCKDNSVCDRPNLCRQSDLKQPARNSLDPSKKNKRKLFDTSFEKLVKRLTSQKYNIIDLDHPAKSCFP